MKDRLAKHPGRVKLTPVPGQENTYDLVRADEPAETGMPLCKETLLPDGLCDTLGLDRTTSEPKDALQALYDRAEMLPAYTYEKGETLSLVSNFSGCEYLCDMGSLSVFEVHYWGNNRSVWLITVNKENGNVGQYTAFTDETYNVSFAVDVLSGTIAVTYGTNKIIVYTLNADGESLSQRTVTYATTGFYDAGRSAICIWNGHLIVSAQSARYTGALFKINMGTGAAANVFTWNQYNGANVLYSYNGTVTILAQGNWVSPSNFETYCFDLTTDAIKARCQKTSWTVERSYIKAAYDGMVWFVVGTELHSIDIFAGSMTTVAMISGVTKTLVVKDDRYAVLAQPDAGVLITLDMQENAVLSQVDIRALLGKEYFSDFRCSSISPWKEIAAPVEGGKYIFLNVLTDSNYKQYSGLLLDVDTLALTPIPIGFAAGGGGCALTDTGAVILCDWIAIHLQKCLLMTERRRSNENRTTTQ